MQKENTSIRLDIKLCKLSGFTRQSCIDYIKRGFVFVNGVVVTKPSKLVLANDDVTFTIPEPVKLDLEPKEIPLKIVFEDEYLAIINKQAGISTHPGGGEFKNTLVNALMSYYGNNLSSIGGVLRPGIVHRLDKETSGLMIIAKTDKSHLLLSKMIQNKEVKRSYIAYCYGVLQGSGTIETYITRNKVDRKKMMVTKNPIGSKVAVTHYKLLDVMFDAALSKVECELVTGRTHQIRVHMTHIGHPLVGDSKYGVKTDSYIKLLFKKHPEVCNKILDINRHLLHSYKISFIHPITNCKIEFETKFDPFKV